MVVPGSIPKIILSVLNYLFICNQMYNISYKYKQFLFLLIKLSIVIGALYFIYTKITQNSNFNFNDFMYLINKKVLSNVSVLLSLLILSYLNWFFEILKWKTLANTVTNISFYESSKQCLASLTTSIITPNRIGEYGAKAVLFNKQFRKKIVLLNLIGNLNQLFITIVFGIIGFIFFVKTFDVEIPILKLRRLAYLFAFIIALIFTGNKLRRGKYKGFYIDKIVTFVKNLAFQIHFKVVFFSLIRYLIFSFQFYYILQLFGIQSDYKTIMMLIFTMYFLASIVPSFAIFDWTIKGSVAIWIFNFIQINAEIIFMVTFLMWLLNYALPSIIGSYFILTFKSNKFKL